MATLISGMYVAWTVVAVILLTGSGRAREPTETEDNSQYIE